MQFQFSDLHLQTLSKSVEVLCSQKCMKKFSTEKERKKPKNALSPHMQSVKCGIPCSLDGSDLVTVA